MNETDRIKMLIRWYYWANFASMVWAVGLTLIFVASALQGAWGWWFAVAISVAGRFYEWPRIKRYRNEIERALVIYEKSL